jgi:hypothetical protein
MFQGYEDNLCPEAVVQDMLNCLSVVAMALEEAISK